MTTNRRSRRNQRNSFLIRKHEFELGRCRWCGGGKLYLEEQRLFNPLCANCHRKIDEHANGYKCLTEPTTYQEMDCKTFMTKYYQWRGS